MKTKYEKLKEVENQINEMCVLRRLKIEAEHFKRIKCMKTLRIFLKIKVKEDGIFLRIDTRVINDFKNTKQMGLSDLIEQVYIIVSNEQISTRMECNNLLCSNSPKYDTTISPEYDTTVSPEYDTTVSTDNTVKHINVENNVTNDLADNKKEPSIFEWTNQGDNIESFELRSQITGSSIKIILVLKNIRDIYKLSPEFSTLLSVSTSTKPNLLGLLYKYICKHNLIDKDYNVTCNDKLRSVFGTDFFLFTDLPEIIEEHLYPIDNVEIDIPFTSDSLCYDIPIEVDDLYQQPKVHQKDVYNLEKKIDNIFEIKSHLEKRKGILEEFSSNPVNYINKWICLELEEFQNKSCLFRDEAVQKLWVKFLKDVN